jgi:hypothetical protein
MRFASQQKVTGRSWMIVPAGSTVSFRISSGGLNERVTFAELGNRLALHPQKHKGHQEWASVEVARPTRNDDQSEVTPTSHGMRIPPRFPKAASNPNIVAPP